MTELKGTRARIRATQAQAAKRAATDAAFAAAGWFYDESDEDDEEDGGGEAGRASSSDEDSTTSSSSSSSSSDDFEERKRQQLATPPAAEAAAAEGDTAASVGEQTRAAEAEEVAAEAAAAMLGNSAPWTASAVDPFTDVFVAGALNESVDQWRAAAQRVLRPPERRHAGGRRRRETVRRLAIDCSAFRVITPASLQPFTVQAGVFGAMAARARVVPPPRRAAILIVDDDRFAVDPLKHFLAKFELAVALDGGGGSGGGDARRGKQQRSDGVRFTLAVEHVTSVKRAWANLRGRRDADPPVLVVMLAQKCADARTAGNPKLFLADLLAFARRRGAGASRPKKA